MKKIILFLIFIFFGYLTTNNTYAACDLNYEWASCCGYYYCSGCNRQNDCDLYNWGSWERSYVDVHEYNSSICCPAYTCATNGNYCTGSDNNDARAAPASGTCPLGQKCINCAPNVTCTLSNAGQTVTAGGSITSNGSGCNPLKTCPAACTCNSVTQSTYCSNSGYTSTTGSAGCPSVWCPGTKANVNGGWGNWGSCSVTCGGGNQTRSCNNPSPACSGSACSGSSSQSCNTQSCCTPSCACASNTCLGSTCSNGCSGTCNGSLSAVNGSAGVCGTAAEKTTASTPPVGATTLCSTGTGTDPTLSGSTYSWTCVGTAGNKCGSSGANTPCTSIKNTSPVFKGLIIKNNVPQIVPAESGNRNQICQIGSNGFNGSRQVTFEVSASDPDGINDIITGGNVTLTWNGKTIPMIGSIGATTIFGGTFDATWNNNTIYPLIVTITDSASQSVSDSSRSFKFWDCKVPVSGTIYDGTNGGNGPSCPNTGFNSTNPNALNLKTLVFNQNGIDFNMTINGDKTSYYSDSGNSLIWSSNSAYPQFNEDISLSNPRILKTLSSSGTSACGDWWIDTVDADPYAASVGITADFSGILIQDPWWQANGGGVISNTSVNGQVPVTCTANNCKISFGGLVSAPSISNAGKSLDNSQTWYYGSTSGSPNNNAKLADYNTNYDYFYSQYFVKKGTGTVLAGKTINNISDLGSDTNNIYFINGDLIINGDILKGINKFLMIIVKGNITVDQNVNTVDGILVANNINASGSNATALTFNGSLYASNSVTFSRDFTTRLNNNTNPAVVVKYDPELIFNLPGDVAKVLTNWQWGN